ncbi:MAG: hypothetical protein AAF533_04000 [Acidobacteriota bacterium]
MNTKNHQSPASRVAQLILSAALFAPIVHASNNPTASCGRILPDPSGGSLHIDSGRSVLGSVFGSSEDVTFNRSCDDVPHINLGPEAKYCILNGDECDEPTSFCEDYGANDGMEIANCAKDGFYFTVSFLAKVGAQDFDEADVYLGVSSFGTPGHVSSAWDLNKELLGTGYLECDSVLTPAVSFRAGRAYMISLAAGEEFEGDGAPAPPIGHMDQEGEYENYWLRFSLTDVTVYSAETMSGQDAIATYNCD